MSIVKIGTFLKNFIFGLMIISLFTIQEVSGASLFDILGGGKKDEQHKQVNINRKIGEISLKIQELENEGKYKEAVPYAEELLKVKEQRDSSINLGFNLTATLNTVARIHYRAGNYERSEELYKRALDLGKNAPPMWRTNLKSSVEGLIQIYNEINRKDEEAEKVFIDAIKSCEDAFGEENILNMSLYANLGDFYLKNVKYNEAEKYYRKALKVQKKSFDEASASGSGFEQAVSAMSAISALTKSAGVQKSQDNKDSSYVGGRVINNLAFVYYKLGEYEKIKSLYFEDSNYLQEKFSTKKLKYDFGGIHPLFIQILNNFANLLGNVDHKFSHDLFVKTSNFNSKMAESIFKNFLADDMKKNYLRNSQIYAHSFISHTTQYLQSEDSAVKDTFDMWSKYKGSIVDFQSKLLYAVKISEDSKVRKKFKEYKKISLELSRMSLTNENLSAEEYLNLKVKKMNIEIELSRLLEPYLKSENIDIGKIISILPKDSVYIDFAKISLFDFQNQNFGEEWYFAFIIRPDTNPAIKIVEIGTAKDIDSIIGGYYNTLESFIASNDSSRSVTIVKKESIETISYPENLKQIGKNLYSRILKPLEPYMSDRKRIIISPDDNLHLIPFEIFVKNEWKYIIEDYTISYITSAKDILKFKENSKIDGNAVIIADPDYDFGLNENEKDKEGTKDDAVFFRGSLSKDMKNLNFGRLIDTKDEANNIEKIFREKMKISTKNFQDKKALDEVLLSVKSPKILHLATHGFFLKNLKIELKNKTLALDGDGKNSQIMVEDPMIRSGVVLTGANVALQSGRDEGIVTSDKIVGLDLRDTELVVLSACNTGVGDVEKGDSVYGLKKAFVLAGAKSLMVSLWSVPSLETTEIMTRFYVLLSEGKNKSEALREAKLEMMKKKENPFYWGAFVISGNPN